MDNSESRSEILKSILKQSPFTRCLWWRQYYARCSISRLTLNCTGLVVSLSKLLFKGQFWTIMNIALNPGFYFYACDHNLMLIIYSFKPPWGTQLSCGYKTYPCVCVRPCLYAHVYIHRETCVLLPVCTYVYIHTCVRIHMCVRAHGVREKRYSSQQHN